MVAKGGEGEEGMGEEGGEPSGARAKRMLGFLGANLINVSQRASFQGAHNPTPLQSDLGETRVLSSALSFQSGGISDVLL